MTPQSTIGNTADTNHGGGSMKEEMIMTIQVPTRYLEEGSDKLKDAIRELVNAANEMQNLARNEL